MLVRVIAPHFNAGIIIRHGRCIAAASPLSWCIGKDRWYLSHYFRRKRWRATIPKSQFAKPAESPRALPQPANPAIGLKRLADGSIDRNHRIIASPSYGEGHGKTSGRSP